MLRRRGFSPFVLVCYSFLAFFSGCANHVVPPPKVEPAPMIGRVTAGIVVAVRTIDQAQDAALTNSILTALGQSQSNIPAVPTEEVVILRADRTATSIVVPVQVDPFGFLPGKKIAIVEAAATMIGPE